MDAMTLEKREEARRAIREKHLAMLQKSTEEERQEGLRNLRGALLPFVDPELLERLRSEN